MAEFDYDVNVRGRRSNLMINKFHEALMIKYRRCLQDYSVTECNLVLQIVRFYISFLFLFQNWLENNWQIILGASLGVTLILIILVSVMLCKRYVQV